MAKVNVVIVDATGNKEQKVGLPDDIKCGIIMVKLVEKIKLPSVGPDGNPISYKFIHKVTGRQLLEAQTLSEAGIKDGDVLRLQPEITAGAFCSKCGAVQAEGAAFCDTCGAPFVAVPTSAPSAPAAPPAYEQPKPQANVAQAVAPVQQRAETVQKPQNKLLGILGKLACIPGILSGVLSCIFGLAMFGMDSGSYEMSVTYGGDAYTGIQNAAAQTANNIQDLGDLTKVGFGFLLLILGFLAIWYFVGKLISLFSGK